MDPRVLTTRRQITSKSTSSDMLVDGPQHDIGEDGNGAEILGRHKELFSSWSKKCGNSIANCKSLWDLSSCVMPPVEESILCKERHELRYSLFCLHSPISTEMQSPRSCPVVLLKNENKKSLSIGYSLMLCYSAIYFHTQDFCYTYGIASKVCTF